MGLDSQRGASSRQLFEGQKRSAARSWSPEVRGSRPSWKGPRKHRAELAEDPMVQHPELLSWKDRLKHHAVLYYHKGSFDPSSGISCSCSGRKSDGEGPRRFEVERSELGGASGRS